MGKYTPDHTPLIAVQEMQTILRALAARRDEVKLVDNRLALFVPRDLVEGDVTRQQVVISALLLGIVSETHAVRNAMPNRMQALWDDAPPPGDLEFQFGFRHSKKLSVDAVMDRVQELAQAPYEELVQRSLHLTGGMHFVDGSNRNPRTIIDPTAPAVGPRPGTTISR